MKEIFYITQNNSRHGPYKYIKAFTDSNNNTVNLQFSTTDVGEKDPYMFELKSTFKDTFGFLANSYHITLKEWNKIKLQLKENLMPSDDHPKQLFEKNVTPRAGVNATDVNYQEHLLGKTRGVQSVVT